MASGAPESKTASSGGFLHVHGAFTVQAHHHRDADVGSGWLISPSVILGGAISCPKGTLQVLLGFGCA